MPIHKSEAIVLKRYNFRETSMIANFYTRDCGKLSGILKGIRKEPAKFASNIEPFSYNEIIFYRSRLGDLHLVSQCDLRESFNNIRNSIDKITAAGLMMELAAAIMPPEDKNEAVFDLILDCLRALDTNGTPEKIMTIFKIKILALSGFKPHFDSCVSCDERIGAAQARFSLSLGGLLCGRCHKKDIKARSIFRGTIASILYIERNNLQTNLNLGMNPQIKKELGIILNSFLEFHLGKELKSERFLNKIEAQLKDGAEFNDSALHLEGASDK
ncbi:MAG: DNA repair protein RecO [Candidatus Omnitrophota bacterium]